MHSRGLNMPRKLEGRAFGGWFEGFASLRSVSQAPFGCLQRRLLGLSTLVPRGYVLPQPHLTSPSLLAVPLGAPVMEIIHDSQDRASPVAALAPQACSQSSRSSCGGSE